MIRCQVAVSFFFLSTFAMIALSLALRFGILLLLGIRLEKSVVMLQYVYLPYQKKKLCCIMLDDSQRNTYDCGRSLVYKMM